MDHENCHRLLSSLSDYMDGNLGTELCAEIERHMEGCENCRIVVDSLRKTIYLYQTTSQQATVPPEVRERLYQRLNLDDWIRK